MQRRVFFLLPLFVQTCLFNLRKKKFIVEKIHLLAYSSILSFFLRERKSSRRFKGSDIFMNRYSNAKSLVPNEVHIRNIYLRAPMSDDRRVIDKKEEK